MQHTVLRQYCELGFALVYLPQLSPVHVSVGSAYAYSTCMLHGKKKGQKLGIQLLFEGWKGILGLSTSNIKKWGI